MSLEGFEFLGERYHKTGAHTLTHSYTLFLHVYYQSNKRETIIPSPKS